MSGEFADSPGKRAVRELWNTPLLKFLYDSLGIKYRYMGLPGVDLLDIQLWKEMIEEVIAFEIPAKPEPDDRQGRRYIIALRRNLRLLRIPAVAYYGPMEEVLIRRVDYEGTKYTQERVITLYNLDFCDEIGSKVETQEAGQKRWRFEAIRRILADQQACYRPGTDPNLFILLLTIRNQSQASILTTLLSDDTSSNTVNYVTSCNVGDNQLPVSGSTGKRQTWALKAFVHSILREYMKNPNISCLFFPMVKYIGKTASSPMLHFMCLCKFGDPEATAPLFLPHGYLTNTTSLGVTTTEPAALEWSAEPGELPGATEAPDPVTWFPDFIRSFLEP